MSQWVSLVELVGTLPNSVAAIAFIGGLSSAKVWAIVLGLLFAIVAIALLVASWTRWGQTKSLTKCIALAFLAHVWLLMYAYGTRIVVPGFGSGNQGGVQGDSGMLSMNWELPELESSDNQEPNYEQDASTENADSQSLLQSEIQPWQAPLQPDAPENRTHVPIPIAALIPETPSLALDPELALTVDRRLSELHVPNIDSEDELVRLMQTANMESVTKTLSPSMDLATAAAATTTPSPTIPIPTESSAVVVQSLPSVVRRADQQPMPMSYQMRLSPMRGQTTLLNGGDSHTEASVELALAWLARSQSRDGSWNAAEHGAGRDPTTRSIGPGGENRHNAGLKANTAMTGLALLALLGAGHTHLDGPYKDHVRSGLQYLRSQQFPSGDLSGRDQVGREPTVRYARMYSHGMAALALTEAYGMTGDTALRPSIQSACQYSLNAMNPSSGGWRYEFPTNDPGDTSQFGWQAMLLTSAANNHVITLAPGSRLLLKRFLDSVSTGQAGGLAAYRPPTNGPLTLDHATPSMTAEAAASRLLLGLPVSPQAADEAQRMLLRNLPGQGEENLYYWYYATIAMFQMKDQTNTSFANANETNSVAWNQWNNAMKQQLCATQLTSGPNQGSWNPTCVWGSYGGRVYSTALACMCLEVYYRYLPIYKQDQIANQWQPARR